jgi:hypothetical protein
MKARVALRVTVCPRDVRFTPKSGHVRCNQECPLWAISGHFAVQSGCQLERKSGELIGFCLK